MTANYSFEQLLSPYDFEILVRDLLSQEFCVELLSFAEGPDKGIDLRCFIDPSNRIVVQCKRTNRLGPSQLKSEYEKLSKLQLDKYYLALSKDISQEKVNQIVKLFSPWMKDESFVYSKNRLNILLDKFPNVLRRHYKLWINSSEIFDQFINNDLLGRSNFLVEDIAKSIKYYFKNDSYDVASKILNQYHFIVISGMPGIGKSTLAKTLVWDYLQNGFEVMEIRNINEGERIFKEGKDKKQVFYFDDFLGENFLQYDVIQGRANDLYMFYKRFVSSPNKILIMTTREYILNQAKERYSKLNKQELDIAKYTLDLSNYSDDSKALILYNHLFYSHVGKRHIQQIIKDRTYSKIINHPNYNPRIIEAMTVNLKDVPSGNYASEFISNLDKPFRVWENAFEREISEYSQMLLYVLNSIGNRVFLTDLTKAVNVLNKEMQIDFGVNSFKESLKETEGTFIKINTYSDGKHVINFLNPSIRDFLNEYMFRYPDLLKTIIKTAPSWTQLINTFINISRSNANLTSVITKRLINDWDNLEEFVLGPTFDSEDSWTRINKGDWYRLSIVANNFDLSCNADLLNSAINRFNELDLSDPHFKDLDYYLQIIEKLKDFTEMDGSRLINEYVKNMINFDNVIGLSDFFKLFPNEFKEYVITNTDFKKKILEIINEEIWSLETAYQLEELLDGFNDVEKDFKLDLSFEREKIEDKIIMLENQENQNKKKVETKSITVTGAKINLENLFSEEMF